MEVDALLAKVSPLKDARGVGDEAGGGEPHGHDSCEGGSHRQEEEDWTDHTSNTLDPIERGLMALKANKGGKGGKKGKGKGFQGNCNYCGKYGHRLNVCWVKNQDMKAKGGSWSAGTGLCWAIDRPSLQFALSRRDERNERAEGGFNGCRWLRVAWYILHHPEGIWLFNDQADPKSLYVYTDTDRAADELTRKSVSCTG